jgi:hypothetical protein
MAFVLEDGSGLPTANSYASFAQFTAYFTDRAVTVSGVQATVEAALIRATDYLDLRFRWKGCKVKPLAEQALQWPRYGVYDEEGYELPSDELPTALVNACCEYAKRALAAELAPDPTVDASGVAVVKSRDKVGPIEVEREFSGASASSSTFKPYPAADRLIRHLIYPEGGRVYRA